MPHPNNDQPQGADQILAEVLADAQRQANQILDSAHRQAEQVIARAFGEALRLSKIVAARAAPAAALRNDDEIQSRKEVAAEAGISLVTLNRLIREGKGPVLTWPSPGRSGIRRRHKREWLDRRAVMKKPAA